MFQFGGLGALFRGRSSSKHPRGDGTGKATFTIKTIASTRLSEQQLLKNCWLLKSPLIAFRRGGKTPLFFWTKFLCRVQH